ncbi:MAG: PBP1A family penicillin-binding protein [Pseudomonadota bacterium]
MKRLKNQPNKPKKSFKQKLKQAWSIFKILVIVGIVTSILGFYYLKHLNRLIEAKFDQPRKWNLPSRIYSDAAYLYPGLDLKTSHIIEKLDRLGYRNVGTEIKGPGDYAQASDHLDIYLHDFKYPLEDFKGFALRLKLVEDQIVELIKLASKEDLSVAKLEPEQISSIFDKQMEDRTVVNLQQVPPMLLQSIIVIEDERYFKHKGVDPWGIARAAVKNLMALRIVEGGSTLTQQLIKNYFLHSKKSFWRKFREQLMAIQLEQNHTKAEILEAYINEIYLGQRGSSSISGVAEAARYFFAKNVDQLTISECALLAGMIRSPYSYNPRLHPERAQERRNFVLNRLLEEDLISEQQYKKALAEPIIMPKAIITAGRAPYFIDFVKMQLADLYPEEVLQTEGLHIFTTLDMSMQLAAEKAVQEGLKTLEQSYGKTLPKDHLGDLQGVLIAMQPANGYIRALVGGRNYAESQFNRAVQANRQPGSAFKPFVYLTALDPRKSDTFYTPASMAEDAAFSVESGGENWSPKNYDNEEHGLVSLRTALEKSYNIVAAKVAINAGLDNVVKTAGQAGIKSKIDPVPSLALGSFEVTPMELAAAYTIFPNGGILAQPISIMHVVTEKGEVLEKETVKMKRVFDAGPVYLTTSLMKGVVDRGTAAAARIWGLEGVAAGKTGTTSNYRDAWFVGFTPNFLALSWVGFDDNAVTNMSGSRAALPIWTDFMKQAAPRSAPDFSSPPGIVLVNIDPVSGKLANNKCPNFIEEVFLEGTQPNEYCDEVKVDEQDMY